jgi:hypothetical protein
MWEKEGVCRQNSLSGDWAFLTFSGNIVGNGNIFSNPLIIDRQVPRKPRLVGGVERPNGSRGTMKNDISFPGSPALWAGSFTKWYSSQEKILFFLFNAFDGAQGGRLTAKPFGRALQSALGHETCRRAHVESLGPNGAQGRRLRPRPSHHRWLPHLSSNFPSRTMVSSTH